jgi:hypothetical protein
LLSKIRIIETRLIVLSRWCFEAETADISIGYGIIWLTMPGKDFEPAERARELQSFKKEFTEMYSPTFLSHAVSGGERLGLDVSLFRKAHILTVRERLQEATGLVISSYEAGRTAIP